LRQLLPSYRKKEVALASPVSREHERQGGGVADAGEGRVLRALRGRSTTSKFNDYILGSTVKGESSSSSERKDYSHMELNREKPSGGPELGACLSANVDHGNFVCDLVVGARVEAMVCKIIYHRYAPTIITDILTINNSDERRLEGVRRHQSKTRRFDFTIR